jgi:hypothetical protein
LESFQQNLKGSLNKFETAVYKLIAYNRHRFYF